MQIQNHYNSYQNDFGQKSHTHHITECIHDEDKVKKKESGITHNNASKGYQKNDAAKATMEYVASFSMEELSVNRKKNGAGFWKGYWNSLGEDKNGNGDFDIRKSLTKGIVGISLVMQGFFSDKVAKPLVSVKNRMKTIPTAFIRKFDKGKETFTAFADESHRFGQNAKGEKGKSKKEEMETMPSVSEHLTDSYNKSGRYCRIQENLTYQKPKIAKAVEKNETKE